MDPDDKKKLRVNFKKIVDNVKTEEVIDSLYADSILTDDDMDQLDIKNAGMTQRSSTRLLIKILPKRGPKAFSCFIKALEDLHSWLAEEIGQTDTSNVEAIDEIDAFTEKEKIEELKNQLLSQTEMLVQSHRDKKLLEEKLKEVEKGGTKVAMNEKQYALLEKTMKQYNLKEEAVVAFVKQYLEGMKRLDKSGAQGDNPLEYQAEGSVRERLEKDDSEDVCDYMDMTEEELIARAIGKYIVKHMMFRDSAVSTYCVAPDMYCERMQMLVDELVDRYADKFHDYLSKLNFDEINGFETLANIGNTLFGEGEQNWGRIATFYAFSSYLAKNFGAGDEKVADNVGNFLGFFIARKLGPWIRESGGWNAFLERIPESSMREREAGMGSWINTVFTFLGLGALVGIVAVKSAPNP